MFERIETEYWNPRMNRSRGSREDGVGDRSEDLRYISSSPSHSSTLSSLNPFDQFTDVVNRIHLPGPVL